MIKKLKIPKVQMSLALILIFLSAFGRLPFPQYVYILILPVASCLLFDLLISYIRIKKLFVPHAAFVTGMIIALLVSPNLTWYKIISICLISIATKNFVRVSNKHIFNPAASGIFIGGLIFNQNVSWWGVSFQDLNTLTVQTIILFIILLSPLYISVLRIKRHFTILAFLLVNTLLTLIASGKFSPNILSLVLLNPTTIFFSTVMLPEPITSPSERKRQIFFGATVGILTFIIGSPFIYNTVFIPDVFIISLLIGNLVFLKKLF